MSEGSSFYMQVHIEKYNLEHFLLEPSKNILDYIDWKDWLVARNTNFIGVDLDRYITDYNHYFEDSIEDRIAEMIEHSSYDEEQKLFIMDTINIPEDFDLFLRYPIAFRSISRYVIPNTSENFLVVYPFWWGARETVNDYADIYGVSQWGEYINHRFG